MHVYCKRHPKLLLIIQLLFGGGYVVPWLHYMCRFTYKWNCVYVAVNRKCLCKACLTGFGSQISCEIRELVKA